MPIYFLLTSGYRYRLGARSETPSAGGPQSPPRRAPEAADAREPLDAASLWRYAAADALLLAVLVAGIVVTSGRIVTQMRRPVEGRALQRRLRTQQ